jgi:hypothetical protein
MQYPKELSFITKLKKKHNIKRIPISIKVTLIKYLGKIPHTGDKASLDLCG